MMIQGAVLRSLIPWDTGLFHRLGQGHAIVSQPQEPGLYELGAKFNLICMFEMWELKRNGVLVGHFFLSGMKVESKGGYIVTLMESKRGRAESATLLIRCPEFLLFDFPNCGAMAISMEVSDHMRQILEGQ